MSMSVEEARIGIQEAIDSYQNSYSATMIKPYTYWGCIERVVDADTIDVNLELGFKLKLHVRFRLLGVNAPETYGVEHASAEYALGKEALAFVKSKIKEGDWVEIESYDGQREKYGRWLCQLFINGQSLNEQLLVHGHSTLYPSHSV